MVVGSAMLKRPTWRAYRGTRAIKRLADIESSIAALADDDLLDLADIFIRAPQTAISAIASAEMAKRNISL